MTDLRVSIVGPFPPPVHGAAEVTRWVAEKLEPIAKIEKLPISPVDGYKGIRYHLSRVSGVISAACALVAGRGPVYLSAAGGFGLGYNVLLAATARLLARRIFIHHHSFAYIDRPDPLAWLMVRAAGSMAVHICLCNRMAGLLIERYGPAHTIVVSNAAFYPPDHNLLPTLVNRPLRIGHLGNLSIEKGLDVVIALAESLVKKGVPFQLMLAGPASNEPASALLRDARRTLGTYLTEFGPLYGAEKKQYFESLDLFVFPTRYINEAEPLVVFEAMSHGLPVIAFDRGCIAEQVGEAGLVVGPDTDFVARAAALIAAWSADKDTYNTARKRAYERFQSLHGNAEQQLTDLLTRLQTAASWRK
jgi:glycosyltransferase involved in cell wall biosynthesis